jgi:formylglycine-generating enzyme required for sulfatase activity
MSLISAVSRGLFGPIPHASRVASSLILLVPLAACGARGRTPIDPGDVDPPRATTITLSKTSVTFDSIGGTAQITATVLDQFGVPMDGVAVAWTSNADSVATVSGGLITATGVGAAVIAGTADSASATAEVRVNKPPEVPARLVAPGGAVGSAPGLTVEVAARVLSNEGNAVVDHPVTFVVASGHGSFSGDSSRTVKTDTEGNASVAWTLPRIEGSYHVTVDARFEDAELEGAPLVVSGTAAECMACTLPDSLFAFIPAGAFQMGSATGLGDERPVHAVTFTRALYMLKTEVTQAEWRKVMGVNPSHFSGCGDTCPVERVNWNEIQDFIAKLNEANPGAHYRLPTEAEWEYAARAGTTGNYGGTGDLDEMGWHLDNSEEHTHPAAQKQPNAWGLYDMHGNVWEWTQDRYSGSYYSDSPAEDPKGPSTGEMRVLRGGSWRDAADAQRSSFRNYGYQTPRSYGDGFRIVRSR